MSDTATYFPKVFIQLSKHQKKAMARHEAMCRRMHEHDKKFPSKGERANQAQALLNEAKAQAIDKVLTAEAQAVTRMANALQAQVSIKARRREVATNG